MDLDVKGRVLATASMDKSARLWDAHTLQPLSDPLVHNSVVNCVRFSPDGLRLVTSTARPTQVRIWDVPTGQPLTDWIDPEEPVSFISFATNGASIVSSDGWKWSFHPMIGPAPAWLPELAEAIAGVRYSANRLSETVPEQALLTLQQQFSRTSEKNALVTWAKQLCGVDGQIR
jgi:WD40 repeat protein